MLNEVDKLNKDEINPLDVIGSEEDDHKPGNVTFAQTPNPFTPIRSKMSIDNKDEPVISQEHSSSKINQYY